MAGGQAASGTPTAAGGAGDGQQVASKPFQVLVAGRVEQLLMHLQPSFASEVRRLAVAEYVCGIIRRCFYPRQVDAFMFGSVPLRTVLPDGDVDISVFCPAVGSASIRDTWVMELLRALEHEQAAPNPLFSITDVHCIQAEVRLVKCIVADLVVDISFDTLGGLCTVAFLEAVDRRIGMNHLFKRSIVLVKAWCYYESRLLGAHHGLISSYALETMVLYIINLYHAQLATPLDVLCKFLQVFSEFDWEQYCLSVHGPIPLSSFPTPSVDWAALPNPELLLDEEFMAEAMQLYSVRPAGLGAHEVVAHSFPLKHLNVVDPLLPSNNLGRSVSRASFARIRQAFLLGYRTLDEAVNKDSPKAAVDSVDLFFKNTWRSPMRTSADNQLFLRRLGNAAGSGFVGGAAMPRSNSLEGLAQALVQQQQQQAMVQLLSDSLLVQQHLQQQQQGVQRLAAAILQQPSSSSLPVAGGNGAQRKQQQQALVVTGAPAAEVRELSSSPVAGPLPKGPAAMHAGLLPAMLMQPSRTLALPSSSHSLLHPAQNGFALAHAQLEDGSPAMPGPGAFPLPQQTAVSSQGAALGLSLHGLLASGQLADALAGDLSSLVRNLHIARCHQQHHQQALQQQHRHQQQQQQQQQQHWRAGFASRQPVPALLSTETTLRQHTHQQQQQQQQYPAAPLNAVRPAGQPGGGLDGAASSPRVPLPVPLSPSPGSQAASPRVPLPMPLGPTPPGSPAAHLLPPPTPPSPAAASSVASPRTLPPAGPVPNGVVVSPSALVAVPPPPPPPLPTGGSPRVPIATYSGAAAANGKPPRRSLDQTSNGVIVSPASSGASASPGQRSWGPIHS